MTAKRYGLVISDWNMEPMTGYDLLCRVRANPQIETTPFIMVTAESKTENVIAAKKAGVNNYIVKPFNAQTLKAKIEAVFAEKPEFAQPSSKPTLRPSSAPGRCATPNAAPSRDPQSPNKSSHHRLRRDAGGFEYRVERGEIRRVARAVSSAWMPEVTNI